MAEHTRSCAICGTKASTSMHFLPKKEDDRKKWLEFIYGTSQPAKYNKTLVLCSTHFQDSDFTNMGEYSRGFATRLILRPGSIPSRRTGTSPQASTSQVLRPPFTHVATQTDRPRRSTRTTQVSMRTLGPHMRSKEVQFDCDIDTKKCESKGVGTSDAPWGPPSSTPIRPVQHRPSKRPRVEEEEEEEEATTSAAAAAADVTDTLSLPDPDPHDPTYDPAAQSMTTLTESSQLSDSFSTSTTGHTDKKYIVFEKNIMELFQRCPRCSKSPELKTYRRGTFLSIDQICHHCEFFRQWKSQPLIKSTPVGNIQLSAAVYFSGSSFYQVQKMFQAMRLQNISYSAFRRHANRFLEPAVIHSWHQLQDTEVESVRHKKVKLGGDMRADSPGHCAKYGTYSLMNLETNSIIDLQLVQSNEVGGSHNMEKEGLTRGLQLLESKGVAVDYIVTDRHPQIQKFLRDRKITHYYDVWHLEKGLSKKVAKAAKEKDCEVVKKWQRGISNHVYWCATSSSSGPEKLAKWKSVMNHMQNKHEHDNPIFPKCLHPDRNSTDRKKWFKPGTKAIQRMEKILVNKRVLNDVEKLSSRYQTSTLEAFHSLMLRFTPKNVVFPFIGMLCRHYLAALHFNENAGRTQARTTKGTLRYSIHYPKAKKGGYSVKPVKTKATYRYVHKMMSLLFEEGHPKP
ncbi:uncharacterized protein LOC134458292 [Engraulis encrasicolus]|uniref:uncharacterized protein LOC134458292 n=1 Tax=Engraulis encrasicolus TaxID=184585 RepID=UPI002FD379B8